ncbi:MAG: DUF929 family protein [Methanothrix sp.]
MSKPNLSRKQAYAIIGVAIVIIAVVALYENSAGGAGKADIKFDNVAVSSSYLSQLYDVATNMTLAANVGIGTTSGYPFPSGSNVSLTSNGMPEMLYIGADYCPFCAITRWGMIIALMRFGNFTQLHYMTSSATDYEPNTATFTFYNSSYSSAYVDFVPVETLTNTYKPLQNMTNEEGIIYSRFNANNTALPANERDAIPFIDFGNKTIQIGAEVSPAIINPYDWNQILSFLQKSPDSPVTQAVIGEANVFTAQICNIDGNKPANVCNQRFVKTINSITGA